VTNLKLISKSQVPREDRTKRTLESRNIIVAFFDLAESYGCWE